MLSNEQSFLTSFPERHAAYTTPRMDIVELAPKTAMQILDVGCSNGAIGRTLKNIKPERSVCGIELDPIFAAEASKYLDYVINADLSSLDWNIALNDRNFDCIIFADVLEHLIDPSHCLDQALKHLRPGGSIIVSLPNIRHISAIWAIFFRGSFPRRNRGIFDSTHLRWFTLNDAQNLLTEHGLNISDVSVALRWGDTGGGYINKILNRLPKSLQTWWPIREFLTYQVSMRGEKTG